jgi:hypothetical protein
MARRLANNENQKLGATRNLAAALLLRQALEDAMDELWERTVPGMKPLSTRAQLITLPFYTDPDLAAQIQFTWCQLSGACHHDSYELPPPLHEIEKAAETVERLVDARVA